MWTSPLHTLPADREWVVAAWPAPHTDIGQRVGIVRRIEGRGWFNRDGAREDEPALWTHRGKIQ